MTRLSHLTFVFKWLLLAVIFLIPFFGSFPYSVPAFANFTSSASAYPTTILVFVCILVIFSNRLAWNRQDMWFHAFLAWTLLSYLVADLRNQSVAITDYFVLAIIFSLYNSSKYLFRRNILSPADLKRTLILSSVPLLGYVFIELGAYALALSPFQQLLGIVEPLIHSFTQGVDENYNLVVHSLRVRGLAMEPSFYACIFAVYLSFFISLRLDKNINSRWYSIALILLLASVFYSGSRSVASAFLLISVLYVLLRLRKR